MPAKSSKKQILLDFAGARGKRPLAIGDLREARNELRRLLGARDRTAFGYIASVLRKAGYDVQFEDRFSDPIMPEAYANRLKDILEFHDLASAQSSLQKLGTILEEYVGAGDEVGERYVRALVRKGRLRALSLAGNPRISAAKQIEKQEIARWFLVWLETPDLFSDWLELRKSSEEFQELFKTMENPPN
jgi:hypothetical protein